MQNRSTQKIESIIKNASMLFERKGFDKVTIEGISQYANVSKVTLYKYFKDKLTLYEHILKIQFEKQLEHTKTIIVSDISYEEKVKQLIEFELSIKLDHSILKQDSNILLSLEMEKHIKSTKAKMRRLRQKLYNEGREKNLIDTDLTDTTLDSIYFTIVHGFSQEQWRIKRLNEQDYIYFINALASSFIKAP
jgi:AcrR family transcriptional regulator